MLLNLFNPYKNGFYNLLFKKFPFTQESVIFCLFILITFKSNNVCSQDINGAYSMDNNDSLANHYCHTDHLHQLKIKNDSTYALRSSDADKNIYMHLQNYNKPNTPMGIAGPVYMIPVVVHVIHQNGTENISDQQIINGIKHLNEAYSGTAPFNGGTITGIQFCLAKQDTNGNYSTGINRVNSALTNIDMSNDQALKDLIRWDTKRYLNIWLVKEICDGPDCRVGGYAYLAAAHGLSYDGIVNEARWFGSSATNSKVHIHETGHYFNLYHTFQNGCTNDHCLLDGDRVCDTPPDNSTAPVYPCSSFANTCSSDQDDPSVNNPFRSKALGGLGDVNDMINNYMDYGLQQCQNLFTHGQSDRMTAALLNERASLLNSNGCNNPCTNLISSNYSPASTTINAGATISFTNASSGATNYDWKINGVSFSSAINPSYNFNNPGKYSILLTASNNDPSCTKSASGNITVICGVASSFKASSTTILKNSSILFSSTSSNAYNYQWLVDGIYSSNSSNLNYTFNTSGIITITLIAGNGFCEDTISNTIVVTDVCATPGKETNIWYFGNKAGLDFNSGVPVALTNGAMNTSEGCSSICDASGNLLFYTSGNTVWSKNHGPMSNGTGLVGHTSSTQSAIIVPHPGNTNLYYIFTTDFHGGAKGLSYSIVDLSFFGGLGKVTTKNILLHAPTTEKVTAILHANQKDIWVVSHDYFSSNFRTYLVDATGLNSSPIITNVGMTHSGSFGYNSQGYLTASPQGNKIALSSDWGNAWEILDFDNATGIPSNPITFTNYNRIYGLEFSPNGKILYASEWVGLCKLYQFDLTGGTYTSINNSAQIIASVNGNYQICALKAAPDGKIYVARLGYTIGRINFPNVPGAGCNYVHNAINLLTGMSQYGLPNAIALSSKQKVDFTYSTDCKNLTKFFLTGDTTAKFQWFFGEPSSGVKDTSYKVNAMHQYSASHSYLVKVIKTNVCSVDTFQKNISVALQNPLPFVNLGKDTSYCNSISLLLDAGNGFSYKWNDNTTNQTNNIQSAGKYWVEVSNANACKASDTIQIIYKGTIPIVNLSDTTVCEGQTHIFDAGFGFAKYKWNDGTFDQKLTAYLPGNYKVTVENVCGTTTDSATLTIKALPLISFSGLDSSYCINHDKSLLQGFPKGGIFSGQGISGNTFKPGSAGEGTQIITYTYIHSNGCAGSSKQKTGIKNDCVFFIPNLITPNGDQLNDRFEIIGKPENSKLEIYSRWGELVYSHSNYDNSWSGEEVAQGIYYFTFTNGFTKEIQKGWLQIIK
jgi:gliding motility-associated-like protein